jgi:hypothetical protein
MMTEFVKLFLTVEFAKVLLIILGLVAAVFVWIWFTNAMAAQMAGWKNLVEKYPAPEIERPGEIFKRLTGNIGSTEFGRGFTVQLIQEGLLVRPGFARRLPILIPWFKISEVAVPEGTVFGREQYLQLTVEWEKRFLLSLPPKALPTLEKNVPADRFRNVKVPPTSLPELLKEGWKNRKSR